MTNMDACRNDIYIMKLNTHNQYKNRQTIKRLIAGTSIFVFSLVIALSSSKTAHAGLVSFLNSVLGGEQVSANEDILNTASNSQTMVLPIPAVNINPNPDKSFDMVPVSGNETLVADIASTNSTSTDVSNTISTYVVRNGDTVSGVAKMFNVSVNTILWANDLSKKSVLKTGQTLVILPVTGIRYVVQKNDTVLALAKKYHADVAEIYDFNNIDSSTKLVVGQSLVIPDAEVESAPVASSDIKHPATKGDIYEPIIGNISNLPSFPNYFACPVQNARLTQKLHGRNAIDLAAPVGTPLLASAAGTVIISKSNGAWNGGYGNFVVISHPNGTQTLYGHMLRTSVAIGQSVSQGQTIGYIGMTGLTTGPHVHFEIRGAKNPFAYNGCN